LEFKTPDTEVFYTPSGRPVYGGGGITPDYVVKAIRAQPILLRLLRQNLIFDYSVRFVAAHEDLQKDFTIDDEALAEFRAFLADREFAYDVADFEEAKQYVVLRLRAQIARVKWDQETESRVLSEADPQVRRARELLDEAEALHEHSRQIDAEPGSHPPLGLRAEVGTEDQD